MKKPGILFFAFLAVAGLVMQVEAVMVEFNGALDLTYYDWGKDGYKSGVSSFDAYEFYLLGTVDIAPDVRGYFETRYEHANSLVELRQGYIDYQVSNYATLRMGYIYMPVGQYWASYYASMRKFASYAMPMRLINVTPWSDSGYMLRGDVPISSLNLNYAVMVANGLNQSYISGTKPRDARQTQDNNDDKTIGGRVGLQNIFQRLEIGVSGASGKYDNLGNKPLTFADTDFTYKINNLELKGEWVQSKAEDLTTTNNVLSTGYYVHAAYKVLKNKGGLNYIEPAVRYEEVNAGRAVTDWFTVSPTDTGIVTRTCVGVNISPREHFLFKLEYGMTNEEKNSKNNDSIYIQTCIDF